MQQAEKIYNIEHINSAVFNILGKSMEYKELIDKVNELEEDLLDVVDVQRRLKKSQKLNEAKAQLEQFKLDVIRLSESFTKIEINTERIRLAKVHYESGSFEEANAVLIEDELKISQNLLIKRKKKQEIELANQLKINADEWLMKARLTAINYNHSDRFQNAKRYFESALVSCENRENLLEYASFLEANLQYTEAYNAIVKAAIKHPEEIAEQRPYKLPANEMEFCYLKGKLEAALEMYKESAISYNKALAASQNLVDPMNIDEKKRHLKILNGLSALYLKTKQSQLALKYANKVIETYEPIINSSLEIKAGFALAVKLKAFAIVSSSKDISDKYRNNNLVESLFDLYTKIYDELATENPDKYSLEVITGLEYRARFKKNQYRYSEAESIFIKAVELARSHSLKNPMVYLPALSRILMAYAQFLGDTLENHEESNRLMLESIGITEQLFVQNPDAYLYDLAHKQRNVAMTFDNLDKAKETIIYLEKSYDNFKLLRSKNAKIYYRDFLLSIVKLAVRYEEIKDFDSSEKSFLELQKEYLALIQDGEESFSYDYVNSFFILAEMFKDYSPNIQKSTFYANSGMEKLDSVPLSKADHDDLKQRISSIILHWQNDKKI